MLCCEQWLQAIFWVVGEVLMWFESPLPTRRCSRQIRLIWRDSPFSRATLKCDFTEIKYLLSPIKAGTTPRVWSVWSLRLDAILWSCLLWSLRFWLGQAVLLLCYICSEVTPSLWAHWGNTSTTWQSRLDSTEARLEMRLKFSRKKVHVLLKWLQTVDYNYNQRLTRIRNLYQMGWKCQI